MISKIDFQDLKVPGVISIHKVQQWPISSIFNKCSMLQQKQSRPNRNFHYNEFVVGNVLRDNLGKKNQPLTSEKNGIIF